MCTERWWTEFKLRPKTFSTCNNLFTVHIGNKMKNVSKYLCVCFIRSVVGSREGGGETGKTKSDLYKTLHTYEVQSKVSAKYHCCCHGWDCQHTFCAQKHTPRSRVLPEKLSGSQLVKKFPAFYRTRRFITTFTQQATCPCLQPDQSSPCLPIPLLWHSF